ncbi:MAG: hypothetical protein EOP39_00175 [Rubrivivax sp.]|nr:MAG: hypothetical protein EOP39_00175 [Rubrivivax sp.]
MNRYTPPVEALQFVIEQVLEAPQAWQRLPALAHVDDARLREVLRQAACFASDVPAPGELPELLNVARFEVLVATHRDWALDARLQRATRECTDTARLLAGAQGLGHLEAATQIAEACVREGRPAGAADRLELVAEHPAVRRVLLDLRSQAEAARVLTCWTALLLDECRHHPDAAVRAEARDLVGLLAPVVKAFLTQLGHQGADRALGVLGACGHAQDPAIEQHLRDSRLAMIQGGSNEMQAIELLQHQVLARPQRLQGLLRVWAAERDALAALARLAGPECQHPLYAWSEEMAHQIETVSAATEALRAALARDPERPLRVADDYLQGLGHALMAWAWARLTRAALLDADPARRARLPTLAAHGRQWLLPVAELHWSRVAADGLALAEFAA